MAGTAAPTLSDYSGLIGIHFRNRFYKLEEFLEFRGSEAEKRAGKIKELDAQIRDVKGYVDGQLAAIQGELSTPQVHEKKPRHRD